VQLINAAKEEVETYQGVTAPLGEIDLIEEDRAVMSTNDSESRATGTLSKSKVPSMIHTAYDCEGLKMRNEIMLVRLLELSWWFYIHGKKQLHDIIEPA